MSHWLFWNVNRWKTRPNVIFLSTTTSVVASNKQTLSLSLSLRHSESQVTHLSVLPISSCKFTLTIPQLFIFLLRKIPFILYKFHPNLSLKLNGYSLFQTPFQNICVFFLQLLCFLLNPNFSVRVCLCCLLSLRLWILIFNCLFLVIFCINLNKIDFIYDEYSHDLWRYRFYMIEYEICHCRCCLLFSLNFFRIICILWLLLLLNLF